MDVGSHNFFVVQCSKFKQSLFIWWQISTIIHKWTMCMVYQNCKNEFEFLWEFLDLDYCTCTVLCIITSIIDYYARHYSQFLRRNFCLKFSPISISLQKYLLQWEKIRKRSEVVMQQLSSHLPFCLLSLSLLSFASMPPSFSLPYNWRRAVIFYSLATWKWLGGWIISYKSGEPTLSLSKVQWRKFRNSEKWYFIIARFLWWNGQMQFHRIS